MSLDQWSPTTLYCYPVTMKLINCPCHHGADGLLEPTAVFCFVLSWRHNNVTLGIGTVWRMTSFAVVQSPMADKDRVLTPFFANFLEYYQHCLIRHLQISLWEMIMQFLPQGLFWEKIHFPSISHYSQSILTILPSGILGTLPGKPP